MAWTTPRTWAVGEIVTAANMNIHMRDNDNAITNSVATSIANLNTHWGGTPPAGAFGRIRVGASPYRFLDLRYDSNLGKWASEQWTVAGGWWSTITHNTTLSTVYSGWEVLALDYDELIAAGLDLQLRAQWMWANGSASDGYCSLLLSGMDDTGGFASETQLFEDVKTLTTGYELGGDIAPTEWRTIAATWDSYDALVGRWGVRSNASPDFTTTYIAGQRVLCRYVSA